MAAPMMAETIDGAQPVFIDVLNAPDQSSRFTSLLPSAACDDTEVKTEGMRMPGCEVDVEGLPAKVVSTKRFKCTECNRYSALSQEQLERHVRKVHRGQNPFQCYMCDYSTYNKPLFEDHVRIHRGIKPFKCNHCPYASASKKNAKKHEKIHRPNNPLKCPSCPFIARHVRSLNRHRQQHNRVSAEELYSEVKQEESREPAEFVCEHCGTDFAEARNLASHQRHIRKCDECDAVLCSKFLYKRHMAYVHAREADEESASFRCQLCPWRGSHKTRVLLHLIHHPAQPVDEQLFDVSVLRKHGILPDINVNL